MRKFNLSVAVAALSAAVSPMFAAAPPTVWYQWTVGAGGNDHWYGVSADRGTWQEMNSLAVSLGYNLVSLSSLGEESFVSPLVPGYVIPGWADGNNVYYGWIGYNDVASEGNFVWSDGSPDIYTHWWPGEPNNSFSVGSYVSDEDAAVLNWFEVGTGWNDLPAGSAHPDFLLPAVFESIGEPQSVPESSHAAVAGGAAVLALGIWRTRRARN